MIPSLALKVGIAMIGLIGLESEKVVWMQGGGGWCMICKQSGVQWSLA